MTQNSLPEPRRSPHTQVVVALDVDTTAEALRIVERLGDRARIYKVGLQVLTADGPDVIRRLVAAGKQVYLALRLFEIPASGAGAVTAAGRHGVSMIAVHAFGGRRFCAPPSTPRALFPPSACWP